MNITAVKEFSFISKDIECEKYVEISEKKGAIYKFLKMQGNENAELRINSEMDLLFSRLGPTIDSDYIEVPLFDSEKYLTINGKDEVDSYLKMRPYEITEKIYSESQNKTFYRIKMLFGNYAYISPEDSTLWNYGMFTIGTIVRNKVDNLVYKVIGIGDLPHEELKISKLDNPEYCVGVHSKDIEKLSLEELRAIKL